MPSHRGTNETQATASKPFNSPLRRAFAAAAPRLSLDRMSSTASGPSSPASYLSNIQRNPSGTPATIQPRARIAAEQEDGVDSDTLDHRILAVDRGKATIGCSYYVAQQGDLFFMEDIDGPQDEIISGCKINSATCCDSADQISEAGSPTHYHSVVPSMRCFRPWYCKVKLDRSQR